MPGSIVVFSLQSKIANVQGLQKILPRRHCTETHAFSWGYEMVVGMNTFVLD